MHFTEILLYLEIFVKVPFQFGLLKRSKGTKVEYFLEDQKKYQGFKKAKFIYNRMDKRVTTMIVSVRNDFPN